MLKFTAKQLKNQPFTALIRKFLSDSGVERVETCGRFLEMLADATLEKTRLHKGNFCKNRFCPMCAWRKARKDALKISVIMKWLEAEYDKAFVFVTLTAPNVKAEDLQAEIDLYNKAFQRLVKRKEIAPIFDGYIRKLEVTYNADQQTYHPHFHVLFVVNKSYFTSRYYVKQAKWLELWREVTGDERITQVDVRRLKNSADKGAAEVAAYTAKDSEYMLSQEVFDVFYNALRGRQILTYNGLFTTGNKLFKTKQLNQFREKDTTEYVWILMYRWGMGEYIEAEKRGLTPEEQERLAGQMVEEADDDE